MTNVSGVTRDLMDFIGLPFNTKVAQFLKFKFGGDKQNNGLVMTWPMLFQYHNICL